MCIIAVLKQSLEHFISAKPEKSWMWHANHIKTRKKHRWPSSKQRAMSSPCAYVKKLCKLCCCPHTSSQWDAGGLLGSFPSESLDLLSPSSRTVILSLWGMKWADHCPLDLSYSLSFTLTHTHSKTFQIESSTESYIHPQTFPPLHGICGSKLVIFQFKPCHICQKPLLNNSDFSLSSSVKS